MRRLKYVLRKVENDEVSRDELISHLGYIVGVLDSAFSDESKSVPNSVPLSLDF